MVIEKKEEKKIRELLSRDMHIHGHSNMTTAQFNIYIFNRENLQARVILRLSICEDETVLIRLGDQFNPDEVLMVMLKKKKKFQLDNLPALAL